MSKINFPSHSEGLKNLRAELKKMLPEESLIIFDQDAQELHRSQNNILKLKVGDKAPDFTLSNAIGMNVNLYSELKKNKILLVFYRGAWCPYCNLALSQYQSILGTVTESGTQLIAVSPQTPDASLTLKEKNQLEFEVLSDNGNMVAHLYTTVFKNGNQPLMEMKKLGIDFNGYYGDDSNEIPVPAVFIIDQNGIISYAKSEGGDYRKRTESEQIINELNK